MYSVCVINYANKDYYYYYQSSHMLDYAYACSATSNW